MRIRSWECIRSKDASFLFGKYPCLTSKHFYCEGVRQAHQVLKDPKLSMGHKCYNRKDSRGATLFFQRLISVNLATGMAADFDRLTGFMEAERPCTRRTENNDGSLSRLA